MNREEALGLLNAKLDQYRKLSYAEFRQSATKLLEIAWGHRTVIMRAENDYRRCHRQLLRRLPVSVDR